MQLFIRGYYYIIIGSKVQEGEEKKLSGSGK